MSVKAERIDVVKFEKIDQDVRSGINQLFRKHGLGLWKINV